MPKSLRDTMACNARQLIKLLGRQAVLSQYEFQGGQLNRWYPGQVEYCPRPRAFCQGDVRSVQVNP